MKGVVSVFICPVYVVLAGARLKSRRKTWSIRQIFAPVDTECVAVPVSDKIGQARYSIISLAVVRFRIIDRARELASRKNVRAEVQTARSSNGLKVGVSP